MELSPINNMSLTQLKETLITKIDELCKAAETDSGFEQEVIGAFNKVILILAELRKGSSIEPLTSHAGILQLEKLVKLARELDEIDPVKADVIDEFIRKIAVEVTDEEYSKAREDGMKKVYQDNAKDFRDSMNTESIQKSVDKTLKQYERKDFPITLSTRHCPDHPGESLIRIGDGLYKCSLDGKVYDWASGFNLLSGARVPGGSVSLQTELYGDNPQLETIFSTRETRQKD